MSRSLPGWVGFVLLFLALAALRARLPEPPPPAVLARLRALRVERDPRRMCARELRALPGVGEVLAQTLARARDTYRGAAPLVWEDVPGIGEVRARNLRAWCRAQGLDADPFAVGVGYPEPMSELARHVSVALLALLTGCGGLQEEQALPAPGASAPATTRARTLVLQGGALHALEAGAEGGRVVLLLHGARFTAQTWNELGTLSVLAQAGYHAVALDWPGSGATPAWGAVDGDELLAGVCAELGGQSIVLVGPSLGGRFAVEFLQRSPAARAVAGLVAIAPALTKAVEEPWTQPTLLLWGERDEVVPLERGEALARRLSARLEVLPGAGHPCYLEQPERFHALLLGFLSTLQ
ncbi:MAG: alpha/beta fold hydrolase [Planctomycetes bacterium]|nr:alpha/beta fold hydrolase [Planctomycetota bacterium]